MVRRAFFRSMLGFTGAAAAAQTPPPSLSTATTRTEAKIAKQHDGPNATDLGLVNGTNTVFTLAFSPIGNAAVSLYKNGSYQREGADFTLAGRTITFLKAPPASADSVDVSYWWLAFV